MEPRENAVVTRQATIALFTLVFIVPTSRFTRKDFRRLADMATVGAQKNGYRILYQQPSSRRALRVGVLPIFNHFFNLGVRGQVWSFVVAELLIRCSDFLTNHPQPNIGATFETTFVAATTRESNAHIH